ncbi:bromodomain-containing protein 4-like [Girardinichthys multiradiatus]|uniref:bromodomain-containing protein 4-like n=1 Tax=Girardinichthys multiradiatus TaxID=208333 RepID=UPI001FABEE7A|nr:bromodomain-containing protein 4-like [Girardinichthys multiradiatus]
MPGTGLQPQLGNRGNKTYPTRHEAANKPHPTQNGRPTYMQAPGQHRYMHPLIGKQLKPPGPARPSSRPLDAPPRPPPSPRERGRPSKLMGTTDRPQHAQQTGCTPPEMQNHQHPGQPSKNNRAKPSCSSPPSQCHSNTTHPSVHRPSAYQQNALLEGESTCNEMVPTHQFRRPLSPVMHRRPPSQGQVPEHARAQTLVTSRQDASPQGPARTPAWGRHTPGTQSPQAHPRHAQEQHAHQASNLCPLTQAPQKHRIQPPDVAPESHQSPTPVGPTPLGARPPSDPSPWIPQMPQTQTLPPHLPQHPTG